MSAFEVRGTRRPGGAGRVRGASGGSIGDTVGPGGCLSGVLGFARGLFWVFVIVAICALIGLLL